MLISCLGVKCSCSPHGCASVCCLRAAHSVEVVQGPVPSMHDPRCSQALCAPGGLRSGLSMRNMSFALAVDWETVPVVGLLHRSRHTFSGFVFPGEYFRTARVPRSTWQ